MSLKTNVGTPEEYLLNKENYLEILKKDGLGSALTQLHYDLREIEFECFEGPRGFNPELYELMKQYREFSVTLWDMRYETEAIYAKN